MRWLVLLCVAAIQPGAGGGLRAYSSQSAGSGGLRGPAPTELALFEFAPSNGAGMGPACACAAPTGAKGEALTFARASSGTCLKTVGTAPQAIANGDMVTCTSNQARVMPGADGTSLNGLLVEDARTNGALRSQELGNAAWTKAHGGDATADPVITSDYAVAPDGTTTAERLQIPAATVGGGGYSFIFQAFAADPSSASIFVRGCEILYDGGCDPNPDGFNQDGGTSSGTTDLCVYNGSWNCASCAYASTSWARCAKANVASGADIGFGNFSGNGSGINRPAQDIFAWGADDELSAFATSYIATTSAAVTRATESTPYVTLSSSISGTASISASFVTPVAGHDGGPNDLVGDGVVGLSPSASPATPTLAVAYNQASNLNCYQQDAGVVGLGGAQAAVDSVWCATAGAGVGRLFSGRLASLYPQAIPGFSPIASNIVTIGGWSTAATPLNGVVKRVCVDPNPSRCAGGLPSVRIAWDGDSEVYGYPAPATSPPVQLTSLIGSQGKVVVDFGSSGDAVAACSARWTASIKGQGYSTLAWSCAVNDMVADATGAATAAAVEVTLAAAIADGERVIVTGITPWKGSASWTVGRQTQTDAYNTLISAWAGTHSATYVDPSSMGGEGGDPLVLLAAYAYNDNVHYSVAGQLKFAQLVQAATP